MQIAGYLYQWYLLQGNMYWNIGTLSRQCVCDVFENTHIQIFDGFSQFVLQENRELNRRLQYV